MARFEVSPGFSLNVDVSGGGPAVVLLHGFTGSATGWGTFRELLDEAFTTYAIDIVGHGNSDKPDSIERYYMANAAAELVEAAKLAGAREAAWVGYSMGGRTALHVAAAHPDRVRCLALLGASQGLATEAERDARAASDEALANRIERDGVEAFVDHWEAIPLFATLQRLDHDVRARIRAGRLANDAKGLANSLRGMGTGAQAPLFDAMAKLTVPILLLAGEQDQKFSEIGRAMAKAAPDAIFEAIPEAGHAAHIENPTATATSMIRFLRRVFNEGETR
jgi:2-succinyl-6-hydroxy-2,4-cyclohexadiene-1-carboxylate synthase